jgi:hypothetical protein
MAAYAPMKPRQKQAAFKLTTKPISLAIWFDYFGKLPSW